MGMVRVDQEGAVATVTLDRPASRNAFNLAMIAELAAAFAQLDRDGSIAAVVLTGSPPSFCAGLDTKEAWPQEFDTLAAGGMGDRDAPAKCRKPIVAAISGAAFGAGCELAMMCDILIADTTAVFAQPEISRGAAPGFGGTQRLARLVGRLVANEMCLTGRKVPAVEAREIGLVNAVVEPEELLRRAMGIAQRIAQSAPHAAAAIKQAILAADMTTLTAGLQLERNLSFALLAARNRSVS